MEKIKIKNKQLAKYLYSLGFDKKEYWLFPKSSEPDESLDFYFYMRKKNRK